jgi:hypothetical protein
VHRFATLAAGFTGVAFNHAVLVDITFRLTDLKTHWTNQEEPLAVHGLTSRKLRRIFILTFKFPDN